jgi:hypothetical protein
MRYLPEHVTQYDGSPCEHTNCWATCGAWSVAAITKSKQTPTPSWFRAKARAFGCRTGGLGDIVHGLTAMGLWSRHCRLVYDKKRADLRALLVKRTGNLVVVPTDFSKWPEEKKCTNSGFDGYHMVGVVCGVGAGENKGKVKTMDPMCGRYKWVDVDAVLAAAIQYNNEHPGQPDGTIDFILVFPPMV